MGYSTRVAALSPPPGYSQPEIWLFGAITFSVVFEK